MREHHDVVVIGGGQAGLAMSNVLLQQGREHVVLERRRIGERWRTERWDSLRFQFPNWTLQLPGYEYAGNDPDGFAHYSDILRLIEHYAVRTGAPVRENSEVLAVAEHDADDGFDVSLAEGSIHARRVVIATGPFQLPFAPQLSHEVSPSVLQLDPTHYRSPEVLPGGAVLVVGSGASGCQIADGAGSGSVPAAHCILGPAERRVGHRLHLCQNVGRLCVIKPGTVHRSIPRFSHGTAMARSGHRGMLLAGC